MMPTPQSMPTPRGLALIAALLLTPAATTAAVPSTSPLRPFLEQTTTPAAPGAGGLQTLSPGQAALDDRVDANQLRHDFDEVLRQYPPTLREVLRLDPSLLTDAAYLSSYPALSAFLQRYPQVVRNPRFYVGEAPTHEPRDAQSRAVDLWQRTIENISIVATFTLVAIGLGWLVRTTLDHRRWLRASKVQVDVHQKLFDRLSTNDDLMTYIQTPAGQRFLEASPAVSDPGASASPRAVSAPVNRILWSVQIGLVLVPLGMGLQWTSRRVVDEVAQLLWFIGVLAVTLGIGFVVSAGVAYYISKRLGLIRETPADADTPRTAPLV
jgi:hypothetical protein